MQETGAEFSTCEKYRYALWRIWGNSLFGNSHALVNFVMLNPSTADASLDDPTIRRCIGYAKSWGYSGVYVTNLFAYRATDPKEMLAASDPIGEENDVWIKEVSRICNLTVAAWGTMGEHLQRAAKIKEMLPDLHYLKLSKEGHPCHPLYLPKGLQASPFIQQRKAA